MGVRHAVAALAGIAGVSASEDMQVNLRVLSANTTAAGNTTLPKPTTAAPIKIDLAVETSFSADIGNMTAKTFVTSMSATKEWKDSTTTSMFDILKAVLSGLKKTEIKNVAAVHKARRLSAARQLAATAIKYDTKFSVVPDYSAGKPSYMKALNSSSANAGMSDLNKLINEVTAAITKATKGGAFAAAALKAVQAAAANNSAFKAALAAAGMPADAISKLKASDITVKAPVVTNGYTGAVQTTSAGYAAGGAAATPAPSTSNAVAAGVAAIVASALMMF